MQHTRSSVGLRAYGQQDPLIEYRKEAIRLFKEMEVAFFRRVAELIPNIRLEAVEREESERRKVQANLILGSGNGGTNTQKRRIAPIHKEEKVGRNELVTITDGTKIETMKYKKAEPLIATGSWSIVEK